MSKMRFLLLLSFLALTASSAWAIDPCPSTGHATGCNVIITISSTGVPSVTGPGGNYDGSEDVLVGVVNNWTGHQILSLHLTGSGIMAFETDGANQGGTACTVSAPFGNCHHNTNAHDAANGNTLYAGFLFGTTYFDGGDDWFTKNNNNDGLVHFDGGLDVGQTAWFSLEEPPGGVGGLTVEIDAVVPEPGSILLLGSVMTFVAIKLRKRLA